MREGVNCEGDTQSITVAFWVDIKVIQTGGGSSLHVLSLPMFCLLLSMYPKLPEAMGIVRRHKHISEAAWY